MSKIAFGMELLWQMMRQETRAVWQQWPRSRAHYVEIFRDILRGGRGIEP